jgi:DNA-binding CsgD family transcriptional regulator
MRREALPTPGWASRILTRYEELEAGELERRVPVPRLTPTEREVLQRLRDGETPQAIADRHTVPVHSVRIHASYAIVKLTRAIADEELEAGELERRVPVPRLTPTEREVLQRLRDGETPQAIADRHTVPVHSVRIHASYAIVKLTRAIADEELAASA